MVQGRRRLRDGIRDARGGGKAREEPGCLGTVPEGHACDAERKGVTVLS